MLHQLKTAIHRPRRVLEADPRHPRFVLTARGHGYRLVVSGAVPAAPRQ
ncbi:MAG: winged helix-turn-helix domain-containing protein [Anaerolineales bacterium]|nr:winged helix-turn-helix domain-containing protein [Anaerolineales bacterium]